MIYLCKKNLNGSKKKEEKKKKTSYFSPNLKEEEIEMQSCP